MSVLFFITTLVIDITIIIMSSHEIFNGENLFCNVLAITLGTLSLMLLSRKCLSSQVRKIDKTTINFNIN